MKLELNNQQEIHNSINTKVQQLKNELDARKELWGTLTPDKRDIWMSKDSVLILSNDVYIYLKTFFGD